MAIITGMMIIPQIAMVRNELTLSRFSPLKTFCKTIHTMIRPDTLPNPPEALVTPRTDASMVTRR